MKREAKRICASPLILDRLPQVTGATWPQPIAEAETTKDSYLIIILDGRNKPTCTAIGAGRTIRMNRSVASALSWS